MARAVCALAEMRDRFAEDFIEIVRRFEIADEAPDLRTVEDGRPDLVAEERAGGGGLVTTVARNEQRKMIKYNHLVANLLFFHTAIGMTRALDGIEADGFGDAVTRGSRP